MPQKRPQTSKLLYLPWIIKHLSYYWKLNTHILKKGVPLKEILILKYPFWFKDAKNPPLLSVDITDACNLRCLYCNNPFFPYPRTMMNQDVFQALIERLKRHPVSRIRISGGEPTLHPQFDLMLKEMSRYCKYLSIITNGQWQNPEVTEKLLNCGLSFIELSMDAGGKDIYETNRPGASYELFMRNIKQLYELRKQQKVDLIIRIRLMVRPSTLNKEKEDSSYFRQFCDCILPQHILQHPETPPQEDVYIQNSILQKALPVCTVTYRDLQIRPDGLVPLCPAKGCAINPEDRIFIGDIQKDEILDLWNAPLLKQMRNAHRTRQGEILALCRNCHYG